MSQSWMDVLTAWVAKRGPVVRVSIARAEGSTPRETGAAMLIGADESEGTIGGGALEQLAIQHARSMLAQHESSETPWRRDVRNVPLGPGLGQCCGGRATLLFELYAAGEAAQLAKSASTLPVAGGCLVLRPLVDGVPVQFAIDRRAFEERPMAVMKQVRAMLAGTQEPAAQLIRGGKGVSDWYIEPACRLTYDLYLYGSGHVGRALVHVLQGLPFRITWIDTARQRFPEVIAAHAQSIIAPDPTQAALAAPADAYHLVMTFSHALDLAICHAILKRGEFAHLGLIGSSTKKARFQRRLRELGISEALLARLVCPIGTPLIAGKAPPTIAISVAADLLQRIAARRTSEKERAEVSH